MSGRYVRRAALTVAPLPIARGTQNKVLESMAMGVPVVASRAAAGGVDAVPGEHLLAADTVTEQCDAICVVARTILPGAPASHGRAARASCRTMPGRSRCSDWIASSNAA